MTRARQYGFPFQGEPGRHNAITDVDGVKVGYTTLIRGEGALETGKGPVRTGVTAILPRGRQDMRPCFGGSASLNAAGEVTGLAWLEERGIFEGPILLTNTHDLGTVRDATIQWMRERGWPRLIDYVIPIVGETYDGLLNDIDGGHIAPTDVMQALDDARDGPLAEGSVGGGTGMISYWYKGGTGTASRQLTLHEGSYTVGVLVQTNYGRRRDLRIGGLPIGQQLMDDLPRYLDPELLPPRLRENRAAWIDPTAVAGDGSIIVIVATDAPLLPHQLRRLAKRPALAMGRLGGIGTTNSGDIFVAFSTANPDIGEGSIPEDARGPATPHQVEMHPNLMLTPLFEAAIDATEEAIVNALCAADAMEGANRLRVPSFPAAKVRDLLARHVLMD